jgi:hypothetical protein
MNLGTQRVHEHGDGGRWMPFHLEERDGEDQPGSMGRISVKRKKIRVVSRKLNAGQLKYLV